MKSASEFWRRAERYRRLWWQFSDPAAVRAISELASEFEMTAGELEKHQQIQDRARKIWIGCGRPDGRDLEIWLTAEREIEAERRFPGSAMYQVPRNRPG